MGRRVRLKCYLGCCASESGCLSSSFILHQDESQQSRSPHLIIEVYRIRLPPSLPHLLLHRPLRLVYRSALLSIRSSLFTQCIEIAHFSPFPCFGFILLSIPNFSVKKSKGKKVADKTQASGSQRRSQSVRSPSPRLSSHHGVVNSEGELMRVIVFRRLSLPASLLEPIPNLEYWQYADRADIFAA